MPIVHVHVLAGRSTDQKNAFARAVTTAAAEHLAAPPGAVRVLIHEIPATEWFTAGEPKTAVPAPR